MLFAGAVLFVKYQMEGVRERVERLASERTGSNFTLGRVRVTGLRGVEIENLSAKFAAEGDAEVQLTVPSALLYVDLVDLLYGRINVEQVRLDQAVLEVTRAPSGAWVASAEAPVPPPEDAAPAEGEASSAPAAAPTTPETATEEVLAVSELPPPDEEVPVEEPSTKEDTGASVDPTAGIFGAIEAVLPTFPFRVVGEDCKVTVRNVVGDSTLALSTVRFDIFRLPDSPEMSGSINGVLGDDENKSVEVRARYVSPQDFDIRISHNQLTPEDVNIFLPAEQHFFQQGTLQPQIRVSGFPNDTIVLSLEAPFTTLAFRDQPAVLPPLTGRLSAFAQYDLATRTLRMTAAQAESPEFSGELTGTVSFQGAEPLIDMRLRAQRLPVREVLNSIMAEQGARFGVAELELNDPYDLSFAVRGTPSKPEFSARAELDSGRLRLEPEDGLLPRGEISLGRVDVSWNATTNTPEGCIVVEDGFLEQKSYGLRAEKLAGTLCLQSDALVLEPFNAMFTGNPLSGKVRFDLISQQAEFELNGSVSNLQETPLAKADKALSVSGTAGIRANGKASLGGASIDLSLDVTQAEVAFEWWLLKPPGTGAVFHGVHVDYQPKKKLAITGGLTLDATEIDAMASLVWHKGKFVLDTIRAKSERIDAGTADRVLRVPYRIAGGGASNASFNWDRVKDMEEANQFSIEGDVDHISFTADTTQVPVVVRGAHVKVDVESLKDNNSKLTVTADEASIPPFKEKWLLPLESKAPPELVAKFRAKKKNHWTYQIEAANLTLPPWKVKNFEAEALDDAAQFHMHRFTGLVGEGSLTGDYLLRDEDNMATLKAQWQNIPSESLLTHLDLPSMLTGICTGDVNYTMDQDDPATLNGTGNFEVMNGKFSADFLVAQLQGSLDGSIGALPPSLAFNRLASDVRMEGDKLTSNALVLESEGLTIDGSGYYIVNGDMDYDIQVALTPETAARIPALQAYFNLEGHRLTQSEIALGFHLSGPSFRPRSAVAGLPPVGVTLVSGAFEMTSDALSIVDLPRQLLVDLFKIGGGIVGAQR